MNTTEERVWYLIVGAFAMILFVLLVDLLESSVYLLVRLSLLGAVVVGIYLLYQLFGELRAIRTELQSIRTVLEQSPESEQTAQSSEEASD
ncbi:hypothetical protein [Halocatena halophila]|uniref:hypothetical protein n=1 Tax=Halocatena halophila TaxID=2814576 RepID=UPI002ED33A99